MKTRNAFVRHAEPSEYGACAWKGCRAAEAKHMGFYEFKNEKVCSDDYPTEPRPWRSRCMRLCDRHRGTFKVKFNVQRAVAVE
jgi:hypothetical protein